MNDRDTGIYLSRRTVYITIAVSLSLNAFFLMMGILIGKDDTQWKGATIEKDPAPVIQKLDDKKDGLDSELALFDEEDESKPPEPLDLAKADPPRVITTPAQQTPAQQAEPPSEKLQTSQVAPPKETQSKPKPVSLASGYWVQVLAIEDEGRAQSFQKKITAQGYPTSVVHESPYYKVLVGPHSERRDAERAMQQINQWFKSKGWIRKI